MDKDRVVFRKEDLVDVFNKERDHIIGLLTDAKVLFENNRFSASISLSILALEEVMKLTFIIKHLEKHEDIKLDQWVNYTRGGSHENKLVAVHLKPLEQLHKVTEFEYLQFIENEKKLGSKQQFSHDFNKIKEPSQLILDRLKKLNKIKKACWYLSDYNTKPYTLNTVCEPKYQTYLAKWIFEMTLAVFNDELLIHKYPAKIFHQIPKELNLLVKDPMWEEIQNYAENIDTFDYQVVIHTASAIIDLFPEEYTRENVKKLIKSKNIG